MPRPQNVKSVKHCISLS